MAANAEFFGGKDGSFAFIVFLVLILLLFGGLGFGY